MEDEIVLSQQGARCRPIPDFCTWAQYFIVYKKATVLVSHLPEKPAFGSLHV